MIDLQTKAMRYLIQLVNLANKEVAIATRHLRIGNMNHVLLNTQNLSMINMSQQQAVNTVGIVHPYTEYDGDSDLVNVEINFRRRLKLSL
jgi:hypothetical protein